MPKAKDESKAPYDPLEALRLTDDELLSPHSNPGLARRWVADAQLRKALRGLVLQEGSAWRVLADAPTLGEAPGVYRVGLMVRPRDTKQAREIVAAAREAVGDE